MKKQALLIELQEDCIFSASAASEGGHESLNCLPGAALLGAAAARLYSTLDKQQAFMLFHSGQMRFLNGLPWDGYSPGWPVPYAWHHAKVKSAGTGGVLSGEALFNFAHADISKIPATQAGVQPQPKQLRQGYVHLNGKWSRPAHAFRLKTAIDADTGRAREGQLFGYDALLSGQFFVSVIEADESVDDALFERVIDALSGELLLGRSRSAEYGRVHITPIELGSLHKPAQAEAQRQTLWLLSDMALTDEYAQPDISLSGKALGLPQAEVVWDKSFLRTRRYSPWNAARQGFDRERQVLAAGSVITLAMPESPGREVLEQWDKGIGLYREAGLGQVWINPSLLQHKQPVFTMRTVNQKQQANVQQPDHELVNWLLEVHSNWRSQAEVRASRIVATYVDAVSRSRRFSGVEEGLAFGPSKSQWSSVGTKARNASQGKALYSELFDGESAVIKVAGKGWDIDIPPVSDEGWKKLADWLKEQLNPEQLFSDSLQDKKYIHFIRNLARRVTDKISNRRV